MALKQIKFDPDMVKEGFPVTALREINVLLSLSHESIVSVKEMVVGTGFDKVFMVMEVSCSELIPFGLLGFPFLGRCLTALRSLWKWT